MEKKIENEIIKRLNFFQQFNYFPLEDELYKFLRLEISESEYKKVLKELIKNNKIKILNFYGQRLFLDSFKLKDTQHKISKRIEEYKKKLSNNRFKLYLKILKFLPQIKFVGLSGSLAWGTASKKDDIDLFIITKKGRLWTARFLAVIFALVLGIKRKRKEKLAPGKVCLNLFFDEKDLKVPKRKQNEYVAFELLALKPLLDKGVYEKLLQENEALVRHYFPNVRFKKSSLTLKKEVDKSKILRLIGDFLEFALGKLQLFLINRHKTRELITSTQLWFFPEDFENKYKKLMEIN